MFYYTSSLAEVWKYRKPKRTEEKVHLDFLPEIAIVNHSFLKRIEVVTKNILKPNKLIALAFMKKTDRVVFLPRIFEQFLGVS